MSRREMIKHAKELLGSKPISFNGTFSDVIENVHNFVFDEVLNTLVSEMNRRGFSNCRAKACKALHNDAYVKIIVEVTTQACFSVNVSFVSIERFESFIKDMCSSYVALNFERLAD